MSGTTQSLFDNGLVVAHATVAPISTLALLSQREVNALCHHGSRQLHDLFRRCALAVLASGAEVDDVRALFDRYRDFDVILEQEARGLRLNLVNAPATAFVGGEMIRGVREHLFAVLRDILYITHELERGAHFDLGSSAGITDAVFKILRNAGVLAPASGAGLVVGWGGHSINRVEYDYTKEVGYALGLRALDVSLADAAAVASSLTPVPGRLQRIAGRDLEVIERDTDRDIYFGAQQAVEYGLIDSVLESTKAGIGVLPK